MDTSHPSTFHKLFSLHQAIMKAIPRALCVLTALLLLHILLIAPLPPRSLERKFLRETIQPKRAVQTLSSESATLKGLHSPAVQNEEAVSMSLKKMPPSKSNPSHN